ncbi:MAG: hypothetical protein LBP74_06610 [Treponema sp.]|jgi:hypothetical protein|nr:hypothetical protein [Treponema sp.]
MFDIIWILSGIIGIIGIICLLIIAHGASKLPKIEEHLRRIVSGEDGLQKVNAAISVKKEDRNIVVKSDYLDKLGQK